MLYKHEDFGFSVFNETIGLTWIDSFGAVLEYGDTTFDEGRKRLSLQSFRIKAATQDAENDKDVEVYGNKNNIGKMLELTFRAPKMIDIDVNPSFMSGAKSYYTRMKEGRMLEFVVKRLSTIPESKKAIIVFPTHEDYRAVLQNPWDDYLPCIVSVQFRMVPNGGSGRYKLNTIFFARSMDIFQKGLGNLVAMAHMSKQVADDIKRETGREISLGFLEGFITDVHLYEETFDEARALASKVRSKNSCTEV